MPPARASANWCVYAAPGLPLRFRYPDPTPTGHAVDVEEEHRPDGGRVHLRSHGRAELYFEVAWYAALTPQVEYAQHTAYLAVRFAEQAFAATALTPTRLDRRAAFTYGFRWDTFERKVVLVPFEPQLCRLIYNPQSPLNAEVLATVELAP
jgi:hypothetical protein